MTTELRGMRRLVSVRAVRLTLDRAKRSAGEGATGRQIIAQLASTMQDHLRADVLEARTFARQAVDLMRSTADYDPAVHGRTDDEIADYILLGFDALSDTEPPRAGGEDR